MLNGTKLSVEKCLMLSDIFQPNVRAFSDLETSCPNPWQRWCCGRRSAEARTSPTRQSQR